MNDTKIINVRLEQEARSERAMVDQLTKRIKSLVAQLRPLGLCDAIVRRVPCATVSSPAWYNKNRTVELYEDRATWCITSSFLYVDSEGETYSAADRSRSAFTLQRLKPHSKTLDSCVKRLEHLLSTVTVS